MARHPMQPVYLDKHGTARFQKNELVSFLLDWASQRGMDLNQLAIMKFSDEDRSQFSQLIGYSVTGYGELDTSLYVEEADKLAEELLEANK